MQRTAWVALAFLVVLAGCASPPSGDGAPDDSPQPADLEVDPQSSLGGIAGVVVDEAIRPIAGALVAFGDGSRNTTTNDQGGFAFTDVEPGAHFLLASAKGFAGVQTSVDVAAGQVTKTKLQMAAVTTVEPYWFTLQHRGFIQASPGIAGPILNILVVTGLGMDNPLCTCTLAFNTTGNDVKTLVVEAFWQDTVPSPTGASTLYLEVFPASLDDGTSDIAGGFLPSPILEHYPIERWGDNETNVNWSARLTGDAYTVQYNQPYDLFVTVFANAPAPSGWSLANQGA